MTTTIKGSLFWRQPFIMNPCFFIFLKNNKVQAQWRNCQYNPYGDRKQRIKGHGRVTAVGMKVRQENDAVASLSPPSLCPCSVCSVRPAMACAIKSAMRRSSTPWMPPSLSKAAPLSKATCTSTSAEAVSTEAGQGLTSSFPSAATVVKIEQVL